MGAENVVVTQATVGLICSWLLARLKAVAWIPWINQHSAGINHTILLATSAAGAVGVHAAWSASQHSLTITGLDLAAIGASLWIWTKQWTVQFLVHRGVFGPVATPPAKP
jgi:hypothetical protein